MSLPNRNNPYTFQGFLEWLDQVDYYSDDPFFQQVVQCYTGDLWPELDRAAKKVSSPASFRWKKLAESLSVPEKRPFMTHFDGHNNQIDRIEFMIDGKLTPESIEKLNAIERTLLDEFDRLFLKLNGKGQTRLLSHAFFSALNGILITFRNYPGQDGDEVQQHMRQVSKTIAEMFTRRS